MIFKPISGCDPIPEVENSQSRDATYASSRSDVYVTGSQLAFTCKDDYFLIGGNPVCNTDGKWEPTNTCQPGSSFLCCIVVENYFSSYISDCVEIDELNVLH